MASSGVVVAIAGASLPALIATESDSAQQRFLDFFTSNIRNAHTRRAYARAVRSFLVWCEGRGVASLVAV